MVGSSPWLQRGSKDPIDCAPLVVIALSRMNSREVMGWLGIKEGHRVALLDAPRRIPEALAAVKATATSKTKRSAGPFDVIVLFSEQRGVLERRFREAARALDPAGGLWVAWPKRASGVPTDLTEGVVREIALATGLVDNKVCAIDGVWSGLRCVYRKKDRPSGPS